MGDRKALFISSLYLSAVLLSLKLPLSHPSVHLSNLFRYMIYPGDNAEVSCGQKSQVGEGREKEVAYRAGVRLR